MRDRKKEKFSSDKTVLTRNTSKFETYIKKESDTKKETETEIEKNEIRKKRHRQKWRKM